ncbi:hypothetical protein LWI28_014971 [Acer negundo]|uniref:Uncharacterized protein n=1 Tax=Acer negundo TaxID=4023 RepID=A0AAD5JQE2_ACENE|nr:hypothetical protein LWI28_014971 [Acer negundo]
MRLNAQITTILRSQHEFDSLVAGVCFFGAEQTGDLKPSTIVCSSSFRIIIGAISQPINGKDTKEQGHGASSWFAQGEYKLIHFSGVELGQVCTIVLRGTSHHVLDKAERPLHDTLCVMTAEFCLEVDGLRW